MQDGDDLPTTTHGAGSNKSRSKVFTLTHQHKIRTSMNEENIINSTPKPSNGALQHQWKKGSNYKTNNSNSKAVPDVQHHQHPSRQKKPQHEHIGQQWAETLWCTFVWPLRSSLWLQLASTHPSAYSHYNLTMTNHQDTLISIHQMLNFGLFQKSPSIHIKYIH